MNESDPFATPVTSRTRTAYSVMTLLAALILFTLTVLLLTGYM
jgi:hypothetical protein